MHLRRSNVSRGNQGCTIAEVIEGVRTCIDLFERALADNSGPATARSAGPVSTWYMYLTHITSPCPNSLPVSLCTHDRDLKKFTNVMTTYMYIHVCGASESDPNYACVCTHVYIHTLYVHVHTCTYM